MNRRKYYSTSIWKWYKTWRWSAIVPLYRNSRFPENTGKWLMKIGCFNSKTQNSKAKIKCFINNSNLKKTLIFDYLHFSIIKLYHLNFKLLLMFLRMFNSFNEIDGQGFVNFELILLNAYFFSSSFFFFTSFGGFYLYWGKGLKYP